MAVAGLACGPAVAFAFGLFAPAGIQAAQWPLAPLAAFEPIEPLPSAPPPQAPPPPADVGEAPPEANKTASGLASKVIAKGKGGGHPGPFDRVTIHYTGWTSTGRMFDSSIPSGEPTTLGLNTVVAGWAEGVQLMVKGEKRRLWIPAALAYGDKSTKPDAPAGDLVFDIELLDFVYMPEPPQVPVDVTAAPDDARKTASGLAYKIIKRGKGKQRPSATSTVEVHYSGWTPDGKMFDSSVARGKPTTFSLDGVIKGWTEGVQLMAVGDKARFWIPGRLAYGDKPARAGAPAGPLVFEIELLSVK
ncbi:MAG: FKBP-type peptidyl-prolyl cis-trans isomerase [Pseudomonadota bacterium]